MKQPYLEVTFRGGRAIAGYLYLGGRAAKKSFTCKRLEPGLVIDFNRLGFPIGIEITAPTKITLASLNAALRALGASPVRKRDLAPLLAA
jgi:hypothetical protein